MLRKTGRVSRDMLQAREKSGIMCGLSEGKQETWVLWTKRREKFPRTSMPQSSMAYEGKANAGTGRMKNLNPLSEWIRFESISGS